MAAVEAQTPRLRNLEGVRVEELEPLLEEEVRVWREKLDWDFGGPADLVRRYLEAGTLTGYALEAQGGLVGYSYYVAEEPKSLIGDLFLAEEYGTPENEGLLLGAVLGAAMQARGVKRIEGQVMLLRWTGQAPLQGAKGLTTHPRYLMTAELGRLRELRPREVEDHALIDRWTERRQEEAAQLIAEAYRGHVDSQVNDQYQTAAGARRFLFNIVQYPGCGRFYQPACRVAIERKTGRLCGVSLGSLVRTVPAGGPGDPGAPGPAERPEVGHITQICVSPAMRGKGLGYELLRRSMESLALAGAARVSLTVTAANQRAVRLYERMGFRVLRKFVALVWTANRGGGAELAAGGMKMGTGSGVHAQTTLGTP